MAFEGSAATAGDNILFVEQLNGNTRFVVLQKRIRTPYVTTSPKR
jgi:hypothetical protein